MNVSVLIGCFLALAEVFSVQPLVRFQSNRCRRYKHYGKILCWRLRIKSSSTGVSNNAARGQVTLPPQGFSTTGVTSAHHGSGSDYSGLAKLAQLAQSIVPGAVNSALHALVEKMTNEAELARTSLSGGGRPFSGVQNLQKGKALAKHLSMNAFVISETTHTILQLLGRKDDLLGSKSFLDQMESPLLTNTALLRPDDHAQAPDPGKCPYPSYNCTPLDMYRSFDGSCNNLRNPIQGRSFTPLFRYLPPDYHWHNGVDDLRRAKDGGPLPSARAVSGAVMPDQNVPHHIHTVMLMQWGQFADHDFSLTAISKVSPTVFDVENTVDIKCGHDGCSAKYDACRPITIPTSDAYFRPSRHKCLEFVRSEAAPNLDCKIGRRQQLNILTSYIDASMVYGSTKEEADSLRDPDTGRGKLLVGANPDAKGKPVLPSSSTDARCLQREPRCFLAGDERVNEQTALTVLHVMFLREHNRIEEQLHKVNPQWDGERLYQETRKIIGAFMQQINYGEFLPIVLGPFYMQEHDLSLRTDGYYDGYNMSTDATVSNVFATAAYRFGHSMLTEVFTRLDNHYHQLPSLRLSEMFFKPSHMLDEKNGGLDGLVRGLCASKIQSVDRFISRDVTRHLFSSHPPDGLGTDLASLNIQRGRDHGLPGYNEWRVFCGLPRASSFHDLADDLTGNTWYIFKQLYKSVDDIDLFPAALAEKPRQDSLLGPTFSCLLGREFHRLRKGDRFWYENLGPFSKDQLKEIRKIRLSKILCVNSDNISTIQPAVFELPFRDAYPDIKMLKKPLNGLTPQWLQQLWTSDYNRRVACSCLPDLDFSKWKQ